MGVSKAPDSQASVTSVKASWAEAMRPWASCIRSMPRRARSATRRKTTTRQTAKRKTPSQPRFHHVQLSEIALLASRERRFARCCHRS
eukprot:13493805-Alexandrium_andersonii.AAC.1